MVIKAGIELIKDMMHHDDIEICPTFRPEALITPIAVAILGLMVLASGALTGEVGLYIGGGTLTAIGVMVSGVVAHNQEQSESGPPSPPPLPSTSKKINLQTAIASVKLRPLPPPLPPTRKKIDLETEIGNVKLKPPQSKITQPNEIKAFIETLEKEPPPALAPEQKNVSHADLDRVIEEIQQQKAPERRPRSSMSTPQEVPQSISGDAFMQTLIKTEPSEITDVPFLDSVLEEGQYTISPDYKGRWGVYLKYEGKIQRVRWIDTSEIPLTIETLREKGTQYKKTYLTPGDCCIIPAGEGQSIVIQLNESGLEYSDIFPDDQRGMYEDVENCGVSSVRIEDSEMLRVQVTLIS